MQNRIKEHIKKSGLMQKEIAEKLDMTPIGLNLLANSQMPKVETFEKVAKALNIPVWRLMFSDEEIEDIRNSTPAKNEVTDVFCCPRCGATLKVVPIDE